MTNVEAASAADRSPHTFWPILAPFATFPAQSHATQPFHSSTCIMGSTSPSASKRAMIDSRNV